MISIDIVIIIFFFIIIITIINISITITFIVHHIMAAKNIIFTFQKQLPEGVPKYFPLK